MTGGSLLLPSLTGKDFSLTSLWSGIANTMPTRSARSRLLPWPLQRNLFGEKFGPTKSIPICLQWLSSLTLSCGIIVAHSAFVSASGYSCWDVSMFAQGCCRVCCFDWPDSSERCALTCGGFRSLFDHRKNGLTECLFRAIPADGTQAACLESGPQLRASIQAQTLLGKLLCAFCNQ